MTSFKITDRYLQLLTMGLLLLCASGCEKLVAVDPPSTSLTSKTVYSDNKTAIATVTALYARIAGQLPSQQGAIASISAAAGLSADELKVLTGQSDQSLIAYFRNELTAVMPGNPIWNDLYLAANSATNIVEGLNAQPTKLEDASSNLTAAVKTQLLGEVKFMRALYYFYLVNLYGDVPLQLTSNVVENSRSARAPVTEVYAQIIKDLREAKESLSDNYLSGNLTSVSSDRIRPNKWAATALLARVYLYTGNWSGAETAASELIGQSAKYRLAPLDQVFERNSQEVIFQLQPVTIGWNSSFGRVFLLTAAGPSTNTDKPFYLNENLVNSFAVDDPRKSNWMAAVKVAGVDYYYPAKYKKGTVIDPDITAAEQMTEYLVLLRLGEQYLIRAEALARQNKLSEAVADVNAIRTRARNGGAGTVVPDYTVGLNLQQVLDAISLERRWELFSEWGDRWLDLKRTGRINAVMAQTTPAKSGSDWQPFQALYPIRADELLNNPNLTQNAGY